MLASNQATTQPSPALRTKRILSGLFSFVFGSFVLMGCSNGSDPFEEKNYTPNTPVQAIQIDVRDREITVSLSDDEQIHVQYSESSKERYDISVSDAGVLTMKSANEKAWTDYIGGKSPAEHRKISLKLPDACLERLAVSTTNEAIRLSALTVTDCVRISSNGGNITFEGLNVGKGLSVTVKNGNIAGTVVGAYEDFTIQTEIKKGESNLPARQGAGDKQLNVAANNGNVTIEFQRP